ncbi:MAG: CoA-binding protein [Thermodesulfobacteriota bacterium]|jgi:acetyltransferase
MLEEIKMRRIKLLHSLLNPKSIAIIGATEKSMYVRKLVDNLQSLKYTGNIYPINPKYQTLFGLKVYPNVTEIPGEIDNVIILIPARLVLDAFKECIRKGVKSAVIITSGFAESQTKEGIEIQEEVKKMASENGVVVCGPNCFGTINLSTGATSFCEKIPMGLEVGDIGIVLQSGGLTASIVNISQQRGIGFRYFISAGNQADLEVSDYFSYMLEDENIRVMAAFIEGVKNIDSFTEVAKGALLKKKPIILLKIGSSEVGARAAFSHTGSNAGNDGIFEKIFLENGIVRVHDIEDLVETASFFSKVLKSGKKAKGKKIGIVTMSGGVACMMGDLGTKYGYKFPSLSKSTLHELQSAIPEFATMANPFDITISVFENPESFEKSVKVFIKESDTDTIGLALATGFPNELGPIQKVISIFSGLQRDTDKLLYIFSVSTMNLNEWGRKFLKETGLPYVSGADRSLRLLDSFIRYSQKVG